MNTNWKDRFHFTRSERNGVLLLSALVLIAFVFPHVYSIFTKPKSVDFTEFETAVQQFYDADKLAEIEAVNEPAYSASFYNKEKKPAKKRPVRLFDFNPNTATFDDLTTLGLSEKTANILIKYRNKGGKFYKKEDLKKIYGLKAADYERLETYIQIQTQKTNSNSNLNSNSNSKKSGNSKKQDTDIVASQPKQVVLFEFDPNTASTDDFVQLGLSPKTAATIVKYREKGGTFYKKEDFKKIYGLKDTDFNRLESHINIVQPQKVNSTSNSKDKFKNENPKFKKPKAKQVNIDINTAAEEDWQELRGIGPSYSTRIVKFRESLGGFHSISQISEVYGLPDSTFQAIRPQLQFNSTSIRKLNINTATADELKTHPYLKWKQANVIINYREQHGAFDSVDDLGKVKVISAEVLAKLKPYLVVE